LQIRDFHVGYK